MGTCSRCDKNSITISDVIGFCADCIRSHFDAVWPQIAKVHAQSRMAYGLPAEPPRDPKGIACDICVNRCRIGEGQVGFCGLRKALGGKLKGGRPHEGNPFHGFASAPSRYRAGFFFDRSATGAVIRAP